MSVLGRREIHDRIAWARAERCQDVWINPGEPFAYERMGDVVVDGERIVSAEGYEAFLNEMLEKDPFNRKRLEESGSFRLARSSESYGRIRAKAYRRMDAARRKQSLADVGAGPRDPRILGYGLSIRLLPESGMSLAEVDGPPVIEELCYIPSGIVAIVGPTGGGKSTLAATMIDARHKRIPGHTTIIGDPIEFIHSSPHSVIDHQEIGVEYESPEDALRTILSNRTHVVSPPELFTSSEIDLAVSLAETDHVVFAQLHAGNCSEAVLRLVEAVSQKDAGNGRARLAQCLVAVVAIRLVRRTNVRSGQLERRAVMEVLVNTGKVREVIRKPERFVELADAMHQGREYGMQTFQQHVMDLAGKSQIARDTQIFAHSTEVVRARLASGKSA